MDKFIYKKSLGQNFLQDQNIINKIVNASGVDKETLVVEIGPGSGNLSKEIIPLSGYSILYEIDERLKDVLLEKLKEYNNYKLIIGDFLKQDILNIREDYNFKKIYIVANLPYYITTPIITKITDLIYPDRIVIMIQEEVADRLSAKCGTKEYAMISVLLGAKYDIKKLFRVSKNCFIPAPQVNSSVIMMEKNDKLKGVDEVKFSQLIKDAFTFKRKNLKNNLSSYNLNKIADFLDRYNYTLSNRAEDIPIDVFIEMTKIL